MSRSKTTYPIIKLSRPTCCERGTLSSLDCRTGTRPTRKMTTSTQRRSPMRTEQLQKLWRMRALQAVEWLCTTPSSRSSRREKTPRTHQLGQPQRDRREPASGATQQERGRVHSVWRRRTGEGATPQSSRMRCFCDLGCTPRRDRSRTAHPSTTFSRSSSASVNNSTECLLLRNHTVRRVDRAS